MNTLTDEQRELLRHTLGVRPDVKPRDYGYRNRLQASVGGDTYDELNQLVALGLMVTGELANEGKYQWFHATEAGCRVIGLNDTQIANAME